MLDLRIDKTGLASRRGALECALDLLPVPTYIKGRDLSAAVWKASGAIVIVCDTAGRVVQCNRACEQMSGYSNDELQGKLLWTVFVSPEGQAASRERLATLLKSRGALVLENEWITKSGQRRLISISTTVLIGEHNQVQNLIT